jgi:GDP/UDP-N,N'-diacetylbacillosamine 2-epimerase (hydrolysing)
MKIGILTSSRADFGIYRPLLKYWKEQNKIDFEIIAFGQHLLPKFGKTYNEILNDGFVVTHTIKAEYSDETPLGIALNYSETLKSFSFFWNKTNYDWVICLGDRYEMAAAVEASIPFQIRFAHIHAGEKTLGAIDEIYRHQISLVASIHFVSLPSYAKRIHNLINKNDTTDVVGAIGLENLKQIKLLNKDEFFLKWKIDLSKPTIFFTLHPETVDFESNEKYSEIIEKTVSSLTDNFQIIASLPNSDTNGNTFRNMWNRASKKTNKIILIEHFGTESYFSCLSHCSLLVGNSSSGIIEAASFKKYVINIGNRQLGRITGENVISVPFNEKMIFQKIKKYVSKSFNGENIYLFDGGLERITLTLINKKNSKCLNT